MPTILLADDDAMLRTLVRATLGTAYRLVEAADGIEAFALARQERPQLALLDGNMPRLDGFSLCRKLKEEPGTRDIVVLMLTGLAGETDQRRGVEAGANGYLTKPFSPSALLAAVEHALAAGGRSDAAIVQALPTIERPPGTSPELAQMLAYARDLNVLYDAAHERAARFRLLVEIGRDLLVARDLEGLLQLALERSTTFAKFDGGSVLLFASPGGPLEVCASLGPDPAGVGFRLENLPKSFLEEAILGRRTVVDNRSEHGPRGDWRPHQVPVASSIFLPLVASSEEPIGVLVLESSIDRQLADDDLDALQLLSAQLASLIDKMLLYRELAQRERQLQDLVGRLFAAHEEERRRVAYDIHDGLAQVAASTHLHLQAFAHRHQPRGAKSRQELDRVLELARRTVGEARRVIADLRPTVLDDYGLATALRLQVDQLLADGWLVSFEEALGSERLPPVIETACFRVAQEALTNVRKHAQTNQVSITLLRNAGGIRLEIRDHGRGFSLSATSERGQPGERVGLSGMRERIALLGGRCSIHSRPGWGTKVTADVPLPSLQKER